MRQQVVPGGSIEAITPLEMAELLEHLYREEVEERVRGAATIALDANGNGQDEVYSPPVGFEFEARRVSVELNTAADPLTAAVLLGTQATTPADASATGAAAALAPALPAQAGITNWVTGFEVTGSGATAGSVIVVTLTGVVGGPLSYDLVIPAGVLNSVTPLIVQFPQPIPATGPNVAITLNVPSFGAGNTNEAATIHGYTQAPAGGKTVEYLRSGTRIEWAQPQYGAAVQVPGVQTWGTEQGPYIRNGEVFEVRARGLTANATLDVTVEGILRRPPQPAGAPHKGAAPGVRSVPHPPRPERATH